MGYYVIERSNLQANGLEKIPEHKFGWELCFGVKEDCVEPSETHFRWHESFEDFLTTLAKAGVTGWLELSGEQGEWEKYVLKDGVVECYEGSIVYGEEPQRVLGREYNPYEGLTEELDCNDACDSDCSKCPLNKDR